MRRSTLLWLWLSLLPAMGGCAFGLRYGGDVSGLRTGVVESGGKRLAYVAGGDPDGVRVILIHGSPGRAAAWARYMREAPPGVEVVAVDRLGYGGSSRGVVTSFEEQAAAIAPLLVERHGCPPIVVGHSLGGPIACRLAEDNPGRVGGLILIGAAMDPGLEELRWYNIAADLLPVAVTLRDYLRVSNREMYAAEGELRELRAGLPGITCPVTIVHGTRDHLVSYANVAYMRRELKGSERVKVVTLPGEDHFVPRERPEVVMREIEEMAEGERVFCGRTRPDLCWGFVSGGGAR